MAVQKWLDPSQDHKAKWLYIWAKEAGLVASRDELAEMLARDALTPPLAELWTVRTREQKAVGCLCQAAAAGDLPALQARLSAHLGGPFNAGCAWQTSPMPPSWRQSCWELELAM